MEDIIHACYAFFGYHGKHQLDNDLFVCEQGDFSGTFQEMIFHVVKHQFVVH